MDLDYLAKYENASFHESVISLLVRVHCNLLNLLVILMVLCDSIIVQSVVFSYELLEGRVQKK